MGLFTPDRNFIITNLDAQTIDLTKYQYTQANITLFRIVNHDNPVDRFNDFIKILEAEKEMCTEKESCDPGQLEGEFIIIWLDPFS